MVMQHIVERVLPALAGEALGQVGRVIIARVLTPTAPVQAPNPAAYDARALAVLRGGATAEAPVEEPTANAGEMDGPACTTCARPAPIEDAVCPACEMNKAVMQAAGYAKAVAEASTDPAAPPLKGYAGTYPLARAALAEALQWAREVRADDRVAAATDRLVGALTKLDAQMADVQDGAAAARIAEAADLARKVAHHITYIYRSPRAAQAAPAADGPNALDRTALAKHALKLAHMVKAGEITREQAISELRAMAGR